MTATWRTVGGWLGRTMLRLGWAAVTLPGPRGVLVLLWSDSPERSTMLLAAAAITTRRYAATAEVMARGSTPFRKALRLVFHESYHVTEQAVPLMRQYPRTGWIRYYVRHVRAFLKAFRLRWPLGQAMHEAHQHSAMELPAFAAADAALDALLPTPRDERPTLDLKVVPS